MQSTEVRGKDVYTNTNAGWQVFFPDILSENRNISIVKNEFALHFRMNGEIQLSEDNTDSQMRISADSLSSTPAEEASAEILQVDTTEAKRQAKYEQTIVEKQYARLAYENVYENTDIIFDLVSNQVKESVVMEQYRPNLAGYSYILETDNLVPILTQDNEILLYAEDGENLIMQMPAPYLFDKDGAFSFDVGISLKQTGDQYLLTYMLPREWLADTERQWPVVLDPVVSCVANNSNAEDQTVYENTNMYSAHTSLAINSGYNTSCKSMRTYIRYNNLPELTSADMIVSASIELYATEKEGASTTLEIREVLETETIGSAAYSYSYDSAGNILTATNSTGSHTYTYGDSSWGDLLTKYDGQSITYDAIGNPTSYYNGTRWTFTWTNGRELTTASNGTNDISYTYGADGLRTSKTVDGEVYTYYYMGDKLVRMTVGTDTVMDFTYDQNGQPYCVTQNGVVSYYVLNQQGDVVRIVNANGATRGVYRYDAWGNLLYITDSDFMRLNPLRYRGYVYDNETGLYYVSSRYYDPEIGRFISADAYAATGQGILGNNMFAYCGNNPVVRADPSGESFAIVLGFNFNLGYRL